MSICLECWGRLGNPLQYSSRVNPMHRAAWRATVHRVAKSQTRWSNLAHMHTFLKNHCCQCIVILDGKDWITGLETGGRKTVLSFSEWVRSHIWMVLAKCSFRPRTIIFSLKCSTKPKGIQTGNCILTKLIFLIWKSNCSRSSIWHFWSFFPSYPGVSQMRRVGVTLFSSVFLQPLAPWAPWGATGPFSRAFWTSLPLF